MSCIVGCSVVIAVQTRAEILYGVATSSWGEARRAAALERLDATVTVPVDETVVQGWAQLTAECKQAGHALQQKMHSSDRWIGATAIAHGLPLLSGDRAFRGVPGLRLWRPDREVLGQS